MLSCELLTGRWTTSQFDWNCTVTLVDTVCTCCNNNNRHIILWSLVCFSVAAATAPAVGVRALRSTTTTWRLAITARWITIALWSPTAALTCKGSKRIALWLHWVRTHDGNTRTFKTQDSVPQIGDWMHNKMRSQYYDSDIALCVTCEARNQRELL